MSDATLVYDLQSFQRINSLQAEVEELRTAVEGGGTEGKGAGMPDELTNAKIAAAEARSDTKIARLEGKIDNLVTLINGVGNQVNSQRAEASANKNSLVAVIVGAAFAIIAAIFTLFSYGASTFYNGTVVRDVVHNEISSSKPAANIPSTGATQAH